MPNGPPTFDALLEAAPDAMLGTDAAGLVVFANERAKTLLLQSDLPITQIAHLVGCSSHSHFSVLFNRVTGVTPRQFRANA